MHLTFAFFFFPPPTVCKLKLSRLLLKFSRTVIFATHITVNRRKKKRYPRQHKFYWSSFSCFLLLQIFIFALRKVEICQRPALHLIMSQPPARMVRNTSKHVTDTNYKALLFKAPSDINNTFYWAKKLSAFFSIVSLTKSSTRTHCCW